MGSTKVEAPPPPPAQPSYGESLADAYEAQLKYAQKLYDMEADPNHGRQAYADLDQQVIQRGLVGADGQGGAIGIIGGQDKYRFAGESGSRKAGYTSGGQFKGTSGLEQDLINQGRQENLKNITALADQYGDDLTDSLRTSKMDSLLRKADDSFTNPTGYRSQGIYSNQETKAKIEASRVRDVNAQGVYAGTRAGKIYDQGQASNIQAGGKAGDIYASGSGRNVSTGNLIRDVNSNLNAKDVGSTFNARDVRSFNISEGGNAGSVSADRVSSPFSARDVTTGGQSRNVNSSEVGDLGGLRSAMSADALNELNNAGLTDRERRQIEEDARASATARGVARNFGSVVDEVAQLDEARRARQAEARAYAGQVAGQESQLRSADIASDMQAQLANQQIDEAYRARSMQASQANQQKDIQGSQMSLSAQMANQQSNLNARLANQQSSNLNLDRSLQAMQANQQSNLQAQLANQQMDAQGSEFSQGAQVANQQRDIQGAQMSLSAQLANQGADKVYQQTNLQAQLANQANDNTGLDRNLQAQLANQANTTEFLNRVVDVQKTNQANRNQALDRGFEAQRLNQQSEEAFQTRLAQASQANQQAGLQAQLANQGADQQEMASVLTAGQQDRDNTFRAIASNNQLGLQTAQMDRDALARRIEIEQATSADPFLAITGQPITGTSIGQSSYARGQSTALPQLYNAGQGLEYMSNQQANLANYQSNVYGARVQAQASKQGALWGALGSIGGSAIKAGMFCWVARAVYGADNPKWILFRHWMLFFSPFWLRAIYLKFGERFANWIEDKPRLKDRIRKWMDSKIIKGA